jgi:transcriptional regulator with XRE-family HTH domain
MARKTLPPLNAALTLLRAGQGWDQKELAEAAGTSSTVISDLERDQRPLTRERLVELAGFMGLPAEAVDRALGFVSWLRDAGRAPGLPDQPGEADRRRIEEIAAATGRLWEGLARTTLSRLTFESRALAARQQAMVLWARLKRRKPAERPGLVKESRELRSWALCELLCAESIKAAPDSADRAVELAELALSIANLVPGEASWRLRVQGYAWAHVGNARRVRGDLPGADEAFREAGELWEVGASGDPGFLDEALVPGLEASLRIEQNRLAEAKSLLGRALAVDRGAIRKQLLISRARLLEWTGDYEGAISTLRQVAPLISGQSDTRLLWVHRFNLASNLCHLNQFAEAEMLLPEVRSLTARLDNSLDALRLRWLEGRIAAGMRNTEVAFSALSWVREELASLGIAYDAAQATLELAVLHLEQGRTRAVKALARQMAPVFRAQGVPAEVLAALKLFCQAAEEEAVTVEMARRLVEYLYRAKHDPQLQYEPGE